MRLLLKRTLIGIILLATAETFALVDSDFKSNSVTKNVDIPGFMDTTHVAINAELLIPAGQKLNKAAPSHIAVYEKIDGKWEKNADFSFNEVFALGSNVTLKKSLQLKSNLSQVAIEATVYHCPALGKGICVIDSFLGKTSRNKKSRNNEINISLAGSPPK